jgi:hypothetical protein
VGHILFTKINKMEKSSKNKGKTTILYKLFNVSNIEFVFHDVEKKKPSPYVGDIWIPTFIIRGAHYVKIFILSMDQREI